jgi:hypothetical protein
MSVMLPSLISSADDFVFRLHGAAAQRFQSLEIARMQVDRIQLAAGRDKLEFSEIQLEEQPALQRRRQQGRSIKLLEIRRQIARQAGLVPRRRRRTRRPRRMVRLDANQVARRRQLLDHPLGVGGVIQRIVDELDLLAMDPIQAIFHHHAIHGRPAAAQLAGQRFDRDAAPEGANDLLAILIGDRIGGAGEDGLLGVILVMLFDDVGDRQRRAVELDANAPGDFVAAPSGKTNRRAASPRRRQR